MVLKRIATFTALFFLALLPAAVSSPAEEGRQAETGAEAGPETTYDLGTVVVREAKIRQAKDDPASYTTVILPEQFASKFRTTEELLSRTPGVSIRRFGGLGQFSTVSIRGSSSEQVLVLVDGVRLNTGEGGSVDFSTIPLEMIERIEVIRGGGTTLYGSDAIGGVVNIVTKKAAGKAASTATFTYGSFDTIKGSATASGSAGNFSGLLSLTHMQSDGDFGYETPEIKNQGQVILPKEDRTRINNEFYSDNVLAKVDWTPTSTVTVTFNNDFFFTDRGQPGTVFDPRERANQDVLRNLTQVRLRKEAFLFSDLNAELVLFNRYDSIHFTDPEPSLGNLAIDTTSHNYSYGFQVGASLYLDLWKTAHGVDFRGEFRRDELRDDPGEGRPGYDDPDRTSYEWHLQDEIVLLGNRVSILPAVQYEESTDFGCHWTGKIGMVAKPVPWLHVKANYQSSYRKPNFSELYFPDQGWIRGNPDLKAEKGRNLDAGLGVDLPRFFFETAYFRNWIDESILWLPVSFWTIMPVNTGPIDAWGVEMDTEYRPWDFLFLSANYTYLHAIAEDTGNQAVGRPRHRANFTASVHSDLGELYAEGQYSSSVPVYSTRTGSVYVDSWFVVNMGVTFNLLSLPWLERTRCLQEWTLSVEVKNLGDATVYDGVMFPLPGRSWFVTLRAAL